MRREEPTRRNKAHLQTKTHLEDLEPPGLLILCLRRSRRRSLRNNNKDYTKRIHMVIGLVMEIIAVVPFVTVTVYLMLILDRDRIERACVSSRVGCNRR